MPQRDPLRLPTGETYGYIGHTRQVDQVNRAHRHPTPITLVIVDAIVTGRFKFEEPQDTRGIPLVGGGPGVIRGTHPEHETLRREHQREQRRRRTADTA